MINKCKKILNRNSFIIFAIFYSFYKAFPNFPVSSALTRIYLIYGFVFFIYNIIKDPKKLIFHNMFSSYLYLFTFIVSVFYNCFYYKIRFRFPFDVFGSFIISLLFLVPRDIDEDANDLKKSYYIIMKILLFFSLLFGIANIAFSINIILNSRVNTIFDFLLKYFTTPFVGVLDNQNKLAWYAIAAMIPSIYFLYSNVKYKNISLTNLFIHLFSILFTGCRSAYLALIISIFYLIFFIYRKKGKVINYKLLVPFIFVIILIIVFFIIIRGVNFKGSNRFEIWYTCILAFLDSNPIIGCSYLMASKVKYDAAINWIADPSKYYILAYAPHNAFLEALCTNGLLGFIAIITLFLRTFYKIYKITIINYRLSNEINAIIICSTLCVINVFCGAMTDVYVLTPRLYMLSHILGMVSIGYISQLYYLLYKDEKKIKYIW